MCFHVPSNSFTCSSHLNSGHPISNTQDKSSAPIHVEHPLRLWPHMNLLAEFLFLVIVGCLGKCTQLGFSLPKRLDYLAGSDQPQSKFVHLSLP